MKFSKLKRDDGNVIEVTTIKSPEFNLDKEERRKVVPWLDSLFIVVSVVMLLVIIIPSLVNTKSSDKEDVIIIAQTIADIANNDHPSNYIYTTNTLLSAAARIKTGPSSKVSLKLSQNDGILVSQKNSFACVKLSSTGAVAYPIDAKSLC